MPHDDDDLEPGEGDDQEDPTEEVRPGAQANPLTNQAFPTRGKDRMKRRPPRPGVGAPQDPDKFQKNATEADEVWNEIVQWLPVKHLQPVDISIQVKRTAPPAPTGGSLPIGRAFNGGAVSGDQTESPGSALLQYIIQYLHVPTSPGGNPAAYDVYFNMRSTGGQIAQGRLALPSVREIMEGQRAAEAALRTQPGMGGFSPPAPQGYQPTPGYSPQPSYQQPPPMQQPVGYGSSGGVDVAHEIGYLRGALQEAISAARERRDPVIQPPPPGVAAPAMSESELEDRVAAKVLLGLQKAGLFPTRQPPDPVPAAQTPPPPPAPPVEGSLEGMIKRSLNGILETVVKATMGSVEGSVKSAMGMGAVPSEPAEEPPEAPGKPEDALPFAVTPVGAAWADGRPMQVAVTKDEDKAIDWMGTMMANPVVAEKAMEMANGLGEALKNFIQSKTPGAATPARVVRQIPVGAVPAGVVEEPSSPNGAGDWRAP